MPTEQTNRTSHISERKLRRGAQEIWEQLGDSSLPKLWIPKREDIRFVESIPTLGTGKLDLRAVRALAAASPQSS